MEWAPGCSSPVHQIEFCLCYTFNFLRAYLHLNTWSQQAKNRCFIPLTRITSNLKALFPNIETPKLCRRALCLDLKNYSNYVNYMIVAYFLVFVLTLILILICLIWFDFFKYDESYHGNENCVAVRRKSSIKTWHIRWQQALVETLRDYTDCFRMTWIYR